MAQKERVLKYIEKQLKENEDRKWVTNILFEIYHSVSMIQEKNKAENKPDEFNEI